VADAAAWGFYAGSSLADGYGYGSGSSYSSGYGSYSSGYGDTYASSYYDSSSIDGDSSRAVTAREAETDRQQDAAAAEGGDQATAPGPDGTKTTSDSAAAADRGYQAFDRARDAFKAGDCAAALDQTDEALKDVPDDLLVQEFKALVLFARGEYAQAADVLHAVLTVRPGMNWTTLSGLYPDVPTYTGQLRALEARCRQDPEAAAPHFVLASHYLIAGHEDTAAAQLKAVLASEPDDREARRLLAALTGTPTASSQPAQPGPGGDRDAAKAPSVDLVGRWRGERDEATFDLSLDERGRFRWQAARQRKATATVSGDYALSKDTLLLKPGDRSPLCALLTRLTPDSFQFKPAGDDSGEPGLVFHRVTTPPAPARDQHGGPGERVNEQ
jgi:tetratricopeptide (TPR) repeat protein